MSSARTQQMKVLRPLDLLESNVDSSGPAVRKHPGPWPHRVRRCDMANDTCSIDGCAKPTDARGWCHTHYTRWYRHGDPLANLRPGGGCSVDGCSREHEARGLCNLHYGRWNQHGSTDDPRPRPEERFWSCIDRTESCWLWTAHTNSREYGIFFMGGRRVLAHRFAYELLVGPIPDGLELDHLCRVTRCVRPAHLEPVTHRENVLRGESLNAKNARKTHCKWDHEFTPENTIREKRGRKCRACKNQRDRERYARWMGRA